MRLPDKEKPGQCGRTGTGPEDTDASNVKTKHSTLLHFPRDPWLMPMVLARRIGRAPIPLKPAAVRCWRVSVQAALGEVRA